jgi:hypothetical protein
MADIIQTYLVPLGVLFTCVTSYLTVRYSRKNVRTTKYIETITSERVKRLEVIRNEVTALIANIHFTLKIYSQKINERRELSKGEPDMSDRDFDNFFLIQTKSALGQQSYIWTESDFILKLSLLKLRLNPIEDKETLVILDYFIRFYRDSDSKSEDDISNAKQKTEELLSHFQIFLKNEWQKCKMETRKE